MKKGAPLFWDAFFGLSPSVFRPFLNRAIDKNGAQITADFFHIDWSPASKRVVNRANAVVHARIRGDAHPLAVRVRSDRLLDTLLKPLGMAGVCGNRDERLIAIHNRAGIVDSVHRCGAAGKLLSQTAGIASVVRRVRIDV